MKILIVDDEPLFSLALQRHLERQGHHVTCAEEGSQALSLAYRFQPDVVILDILLPHIDGIEVLRGLRAFSGVPVLVLSVVGQESVIVEALDEGADDYLLKPPVLEELRVRLQALVRRAHESVRAELVYDDGWLHVDLQNLVLRRNGEPVTLSPLQWSVLSCLVRNVGRMVTFEQMAREALRSDLDLTHAKAHLAVLVHSLRRAIEADPSVPTYIVTHMRVGYRFVGRPSEGTWASREAGQ